MGRSRRERDGAQACGAFIDRFAAWRTPRHQVSRPDLELRGRTAQGGRTLGRDASAPARCMAGSRRAAGRLRLALGLPPLERGSRQDDLTKLLFDYEAVA